MVIKVCPNPAHRSKILLEYNRLRELQNFPSQIIFYTQSLIFVRFTNLILVPMKDDDLTFQKCLSTPEGGL